MINFCTLFDSNYLTRGLVLYESLRRTSEEFHLYVVAFNQEAYSFLSEASLPGLTPISLKEFEDEQLLKVKPTRSAAEYCWTSTPSVILYCIERFRLPSCTYIDADMVFYRDPKILIDEMGDDSILISEHRYSSDYDQSEASGKYCVQFMCFKNNQQGMTALRWWRDRCLEWCYARKEDGKFGDQKYLDDWTDRFQGVHVMQHPGGGVAPWNIQQFRIREKGLMLVEKKSGREVPLIFFHFHGLKFYTDYLVSCCGPLYEISAEVKRLLYIPYISELVSVEKKIKGQVGYNVNGARTKAPRKWNVFLEFIKGRLLLWKMGNVSIGQLAIFRFKQHYHFLRLKFIDQHG